ncbi:Protein FAM32A [Taenia crassiceps]|uniref:Protein FAM32A n=1 Tax=Taenia crassiceps TaxID=6207 RepID=A0ABR4QSN6_9CEST
MGTLILSKSTSAGSFETKDREQSSESRKHKKHPLKSNGDQNSNVGVLEEKNEPKITKTAAEVEFEKKKEKRMMERILTKAEKSHKQRIMEFNEHLNSMMKHFFLPIWTHTRDPSLYRIFFA